MRVLLDENLPVRLKAHISDHEVFAVTEIGWSSMPDSDVIDQAESRFDVLLTADRSMRHQHNWADRKLSLVVLRGPDNRLQTLRLLMPQVNNALALLQPGSIVEIE